MEGILTLEDIIEEIVGDIQDEYDAGEEEWFTQAGKNVFVIKGQASIKDINRKLPLELPESGKYTTLAGFCLYELGRIPHEKEVLMYKGHKFTVEKMTKRHISLVRAEIHNA
jgi:putative hemolysin